MSSPTRRKPRPLSGGLRNSLLPMGILVALFLRYGLGIEFVPAAFCALPFFVLFVIGPGWAGRSGAAFDRDAVRLLSQGKPNALVRRYRAAWPLRLWGSPAARESRLGWALFEAGEYERAHAAYQKALGGFEKPAYAPEALLVMAAQASLLCGHDDDAIGHYRALVTDALPDVKLRLAFALVRRANKGDRKEAKELLRALESGVKDARLHLVRALMHAVDGKQKSAKSALRQAEKGEQRDAVLERQIRELLAKTS